MYLREFDATVVAIEGDMVSLDRTAFYPTGGGQPNDTGILVTDGISYDVADVIKVGDDVGHRISSSSLPQPGAKVHGVLDWTEGMLI